MQTFFSPKSRLSVSKPLAHTMNTLNLISPLLLFIAVILALVAKFGKQPAEIRNLMMTYAAILIGISLMLRILWGISLRVIQRRNGKENRKC